MMTRGRTFVAMRDSVFFTDRRSAFRPGEMFAVRAKQDSDIEPGPPDPH